MSSWGNKEVQFLAGTSVNTGGATGVTLTGVSTTFLTQVKSGDLFVQGPTSQKAAVLTVNSNTSITLKSSIYLASGSTGFFVSQMPKYLSETEKKTQTYGVDTKEMGATGPTGALITPGPGHAGWVKVVQQSGYVKEISLNTTGATGYNPAVLPNVSFSGTGGASGVAVVSSAGAVTSVTVTNAGSYTTTAPTVTIGSTGATGVVGTVIMGGRFNRKIHETLVAIGVPAATMGDAEDTIFPDV
jgi:hypothetical protein